MKSNYFDNIFIAMIVMILILPNNFLMGFIRLSLAIGLLYVVIRYPLKYRHLYFGILAILYFLVVIFYSDSTGRLTVSFGIIDYVLLAVIFFLEVHLESFEKKVIEKSNKIVIPSPEQQILEECKKDSNTDTI